MKQDWIMGTAIIVLFVSACYSCFGVAKVMHQRDCNGHDCDWAWCDNYNGSDGLHDFNF